MYSIAWPPATRLGPWLVLVRKASTEGLAVLTWTPTAMQNEAVAYFVHLIIERGLPLDMILKLGMPLKVDTTRKV